ncbi:prepilin peptidase [Butyrivibrio sp. AE3004]|uniref:prepilin peptidase n=1 Tax=Butyrivibrio sp. AE3004 TaxID=1506994 RepID=UPI00049441E6|nr:A24 family peptidase [Butyrivibrio sp. AE3004]
MAEQIYYIVCISLFGLIFGSFLNCMAMRIVRKEDFVKGRSHCMDCGHELTAADLIPVFSYAIHGGKCRYCGKKISVRYPLAELTFMLLSVVLFLHTGTDWITFYKNWLLTGCLFAIALVDLESFEIPDNLLITALIGWAGFSVIEVIFFGQSIKFIGIRVLTGLIFGAGMLLISLLMDRIFKKDSLGGGDIKLFALLGLYLGFAGSYELIILSCIFGLIFAFLRKKFDSKASEEFPFGPAIAAGAYVILIFGDAITDWYLSLL